MKQRIITLIALLCALAGTASATTKTYTVTGGQDNQGTGFYALFSDGSNSSSQVNWTYNSNAEISFNLRTNLTLTLSNTAKQLVYSNGAIGGRGSTTLTVSSNNNYYIYHVRLLDSSGNVIQLDANGNAVNHGGVSECDYWNMTKSFSHTYSNGILFSKIEVSYATTIPITDAVISGLDSQYSVSNAAVAPTPTVTWHGTTLTKDTHYTLSYQNNTAPGTATVTATGKGIFSSSTSKSANYTLVWATYSVRFNKNNAAATGTMSDQAFYYTEEKALTATAFTRTGYTFTGWSTTPDGDVAYTNGQEVTNLTATDGATVDLYAQWTDVWGIAGGADGSEEHPYIITTTAGLDLLAQNVNSGNEYGNTYFKLGADIAYPHTTDWDDANSTENNYTAIGNYDYYFCGIFDGDGHTVSGIRINKPSDNYQGLFGRVNGAKVKNVTLNDARITGLRYVGGIAGQMNGSSAQIENCLVLNTAITANNYHGAVVGYRNYGTLNNNHYRNCTVNGNTTGVGCNGSDRDGARSVHALTLPDGVTVTGESVEIDGTTYYASNTIVTLSYSAPEGYIFVGLQVKDADNNDIAVTDNGDGTYTFTMPAADATVPSALVDVWGIAGGATGSNSKPYIITTTAGLDLLATKVNKGNEYSNKYFKLGADIAYDPTAVDANGENYTAIGGYNNGFRGTFDGDGHTVSGIRINKTGSTDADRKQGLFGYLYYGTVQNVILNDAHITGRSQVGGITGDMSFATITNCLVLNTAITATASGSTNIGVISGYYSGTLTANYYHNCTLTIVGTTSTTNIGSGQNSVFDRDGARSVHALTLPAGVTATGESVVIDGTTYYASNTTVTLSYSAPEGYIFVGLQVKDADNTDIAVTDNGDGTYTFTMPAEDATVTSTFADVWGIAGGATGSYSKPYVITTTAGLDLLATKVNNGNNFSGTYFKLGADIAYDPNALDANGENYTAIGGYNNGFRGTFDGDGHTVSGIRIKKTGSTNAERKLGLFGYLFYGTVQNVILNDAHITGNSLVGGITGDMSSATITNCLVLNTAITATNNGAQPGVISGFYSGTLTANYYHNCSLTKGDATSTTNIGTGRSSVFDRDGARSVHALTLPAGVTATGESVVIDGTTYYASNTIVTLSCTQPGYDISDVTVNDTPLDGNTFTMPAADATVTATLTSNILYEIAYLDEDGNAQTTPEDVPVFPFTGTETTLGASGETTWYLVNSNITIEDDTNVALAGNVNLILADGSSFDGNFCYYLTSNFSYSLTIYAQSTGDNMGSFRLFWQLGYGISALNIHGGNISLSNGGSSIPLFDDYPVSITGGRVSLSSEHACFGENCTVTLGCTAPTDYIYIGGVYAYPTLNVSIKEGQILSDGSHLYSGTLTKRISYDDNEAETEVYRLRGEMVLRLYTGSLLADNDSEKPAGSKNEDIISTLDDDATHTLALQGRIFYKDNQWNTLCLPFDVSSLNGTPLDGATLMELDDSEDGGTGYDASTGTLSLYFKEATSIEAGKPYLMKWSSDDGEFFYNPVFNDVTIDNSAAALARKTVTSNDGKVSFCSTYDALSFTADNRSILFLGGENTLYYPEEGAHINAFRAYFQLNGISATDLPAGNVKMFFGDESPTDGVGEVQGSKFKVLGDDSWYDLNGRRLNGKPTQRGIYIHNGRKVVIK